MAAFCRLKLTRPPDLTPGERIEARRYAAVLVLRELTRSAPALIYDNVPDLLDNLWTALRDPKVRKMPTLKAGPAG